MNSLHLEAVVGGVRALLFCCAMVSALTFLPEVKPAFTVICAIIRRNARGYQLVGLASFGWFIGALGSMCLTGRRIFAFLAYGESPAGLGMGYDALWTALDLYMLAAGFYIPVFCVHWYRGRRTLAIALGVMACIVGSIFGLAADRIPHRLCYIVVH